MDGKIHMTYDLAMAAGQDAATRRMRKQGRTKWNRGDWDAAARTFNRLYPLKQQLKDMALRRAELAAQPSQGE